MLLGSLPLRLLCFLVCVVDVFEVVHGMQLIFLLCLHVMLQRLQDLSRIRLGVGQNLSPTITNIIILLS